MDQHDYRQKFEQILADTVIPEGTAPDATRDKVSALVDFINKHIPAQLFRFRSCSELNIDAFERDVLYAVTPDKFNDPYDALFRYNKDYIIKEINAGFDIEAGKQLLRYIADTDTMPDFFIKLYGPTLCEKITQQVRKNKTNLDKLAEDLFNNFQPHRDEYISNVESLLAESTRVMKQSAAVVCFSESINSVLMWSHYADYHKGLALEYDLRHFEMKCGKCDKRESCKLMTLGNVYPVIYSDERYDATQHALTFAAEIQAQQNGGHFPQPDIAVFLKAFLHKSTQWEYEKEWRLIFNRLGCDYSKPIDLIQPPLAIYYGSNISASNRKILHSIAKNKGLREYQMHIDESSSNYEMKIRPNMD